MPLRKMIFPSRRICPIFPCKKNILPQTMFRVVTGLRWTGLPDTILTLRSWRPFKEVPKPRAGKVPRRVLRKVPALNGVPGDSAERSALLVPSLIVLLQRRGIEALFRHFPPRRPVWDRHVPKHSSRHFACNKNAGRRVQFSLGWKFRITIHTRKITGRKIVFGNYLKSPT